MADDIVTRLRDIASRCWCAEKSQGEPVGKPFFRCESCDDQLRAAGEIERLRAAGDALAEALDWNLSCPCNDEPLHGLDAEMNTRSLTAQRAWHEARRG